MATLSSQFTLLPFVWATALLRTTAIHMHRQNLSTGTNRQGLRPSKDDEVDARNNPLVVSPDWFSSFSEGESTYDADADYGGAGNVNSPQIQFQDGWVPEVNAPAGVGTTVGTDPVFFHESMSGGPEAAWQTHYPAVVGGLSKHSGSIGGPWFKRRAGSYGQGFVATEGVKNYYGGSVDNPLLVTKMSGDLPPDWFDNSVLQHDGFGREKFPSMVSPRRLVGWTERAVNTTLTCAVPGCSAAATIQMFNPYTERARNCVFSLLVHPTDFDQSYSGEEVSWITVNNVTVKTSCQPQVSGCKAPVSQQLHACVVNLPLDKIMTATGLLEIRAKIPDVVDECPYEGNLLSGVPVATCMVAPQDQSPVFGMSPNQPSSLLSSSNGTHTTLLAPLKCKERGCKAYYVFQDYQNGDNFTTCEMKVTVNQTDFDSMFEPEQIEYIAVQGVNVTAAPVSPGKNPCQAVLAGEPLPDDQLEFVVVQNVDVTNAINSGSFIVDGKITPNVDECASQGFLFDGMIRIDCTL